MPQSGVYDLETRGPSSPMSRVQNAAGSVSGKVKKVGRVAAIPLVRLGKATDRFIIDPRRMWRQIWDIWIACTVLFLSYTLPFQICFDRILEHDEDWESTWYTMYKIL